MQTCICMLIALLVFTWKSMHHSVFSNFPTYNVIETELTNFQSMFHLWANQVAGFYQQNVWKSTCERVTLYVKMQVKCHSCTGFFFTHFASTNQLPCLPICGTLAGNGLNKKHPVFWKLISNPRWNVQYYRYHVVFIPYHVRYKW